MSSLSGADRLIVRADGGGLGTARLVAILAPAALLAGALYFQFGLGLFPCEMCVWQRWPLVAAIVLGAASLALARRAARIALVSAGVAMLLSAAIGAFHAGVEYGWWEGITPCSVSATGGTGRSDADILAEIMAAPIVRCDVAPWSLFGISIAGYNALLSGAAAILVMLLAARATRSVR